MSVDSKTEALKWVGHQQTLYLEQRPPIAHQSKQQPSNEARRR